MTSDINQHTPTFSNGEEHSPESERPVHFYLISPFSLFAITFVVFIFGMSVVSNPRKLQCFKCWRDGVPPVWLVCIAMVVVQVSHRLQHLYVSVDIIVSMWFFYTIILYIYIL